MSLAAYADVGMSDVTRILSQIELGDPAAAEQLLPLVYDELRKLAAAKLAQEKPGQTLQATALVHEAYLRLVDGRSKVSEQQLEMVARALLRRRRRGDAADSGRQCPPQAAAQARRRSAARGSGRQSRSLSDGPSDDDLLALDEALDKLAAVEPLSAEAGQAHVFCRAVDADEAAEALGISPRTADRHWAYARAWLHQRIDRDALTRKSQSILQRFRGVRWAGKLALLIRRRSARGSRRWTN